MLKFVITIFSIICISVPVHAEDIPPRGIRLDGTIGSAGTFDLPGPDYEIKSEYGRQAGSNLFHSFQQFNIHADESAVFTGPGSVQNIISRVTGGEPSWIDGTLGTAIPSADLWFLNPAGLMFGPNASLELAGSFHASTVDYLRMGENERFFSLAQKDEVLSVAKPAAFGFLDGDIGPISIQGKGEIAAQDWGGLYTNGLVIPGERTLSLIGGDIEIKNGDRIKIGDEVQPLGTLIVPEQGKINMVSLAAPGEVTLGESGPDVSSFEHLGDIRISDQSALHVGGGKIFIRGGSFFADNSFINAGQIQFPGYGILGGNNGRIDIETDTLSLSESGISIETYGPGRGGDAEIRASESVYVSSGEITTASFGESEGAGDAGRIRIESKHLVFYTFAFFSDC